MKDIPAQELEASFLRGPLSFPHPTNSEPSINNFEPISETGTTNASLGPASPLKHATQNANFFGKARYSKIMANYVRITIVQRRKWQVCWLMVSAFTSQPLLREVCSSILLSWTIDTVLQTLRHFLIKTVLTNPFAKHMNVGFTNS